jgi:hypothetical protein
VILFEANLITYRGDDYGEQKENNN